MNDPLTPQEKRVADLLAGREKVTVDDIGLLLPKFLEAYQRWTRLVELIHQAAGGKRS